MAGNEPPEASASWTVDYVAPDAPVLNGAPQAFTNSSGASIGFSGEQGASFTCSVDGGAYAPCGSSPRVLSGLASGAHSLSVRQTDQAGNVSPVAKAEWTVDLTAPVTPGLSGAPAALTKSTGASIAFTGEAGASFTCSVDGGAYGACGSSPKVLSGLGDGPHSLAVRQADRAGNLGPAASASWTVDSTAPAAPVLSGAPAAYTTSTGASIGFSGEQGASFTCSIDGGAWVACGSSPRVRFSLAEGSRSSRSGRRTLWGMSRRLRLPHGSLIALLPRLLVFRRIARVRRIVVTRA